MKKVTAIAAIVAAAQIIGGSAFASSPTGPDIEKAKENSSIVRTVSEDFSTRIVEDSNLPSGIEVVVQEGSPGERTFFKASENFKGTDGGVVSVPILYDEITKLPIQKVVRKGANAVVIDGISDKTKAAEKAKADAKIAADAKQKADDETAKVAAEVAQRSAASIPTTPTTARTSVTQSALSPAPSASGVTSVEENKAYARSILSPADFTCTDQLAQRESGWSTTATNPSSGAYGVAQSLPAGKMISAGADWKTNGKTQINWMISYMNERYGSPCNALAHSHSVGWY